MCLCLCATRNETGAPPEELAALHHDLVQVDGKRRTAVPLGGFITALATRPGLGVPELKCAGLPAKWEQEGSGSRAGSKAEER